MDEIHPWGEQVFNEMKILGSVSFRTSRKEFEEQMDIKLEGEWEFLKKIRPKEARSLISYEVLLYLDGEPLDGWASAHINQTTAEFESVGIPQIFEGKYRQIGWEKVHKNSDDYDIMERQKQTLELCTAENDRLLGMVEAFLIERKKPIRDR